MKENNLSANFKELVRSLEAIDRDDEMYVGRDEAPNRATADRRAAIAALSAIQHFLLSSRRAVPGFSGVSAALYQLRLDLKAVEFPGITPEIFKPTQTAGRKPDSKFVQQLKGRFAAMVYLQMQAGMPREQAVNWVARNIPADLAGQVAKKPIRPSSIKEWMNEFGCNKQARNEIKLVKSADEFRAFTAKNYQSNSINGSFGVLGFLSMMYLGNSCLAAGEPVPFSEIFTALQQEWAPFVLEFDADE